MTTELDAELVLDADAILGEGPVWDADAGVLWWVDIEGRQIHRFDPATRADTAIPTPTMVGAVALRARDGLLAALADGVYTVDVESSALTPFRPLDEPPNVRSNESKCDPAGRLLVGTMAYDYAPIGSLYSIDAGGSVTWNASPVNVQDLPARMETEVQRDPTNQPELRIEANSESHYDVMAKVLAAAKNAQMMKIGFVQ